MMTTEAKRAALVAQTRGQARPRRIDWPKLTAWLVAILGCVAVLAAVWLALVAWL